MATAHFSHDELKCKCGCEQEVMDPVFMRRIEELRVAYGKPIRVTSAYRCPDHDAAVGGAGVHPSGRAIDMACSGKAYREILAIAVALNFAGIGISQRGPHAKRFMHLDDMQSVLHPRPTGWTY